MANDSLLQRRRSLNLRGRVSMTRAFLFVALSLAFFAVAACATSDSVESDGRGFDAPVTLVVDNVTLHDRTGIHHVVIRGDRIDAVAAGRSTATDAVVIDGAGGLMLPGFHDAHVHLLSGGFSLLQMDLAGLTTLDDVKAEIHRYAAAHPDVAVLVGRGWDYGIVPHGTFPTAADIDDAESSRPVVLESYDAHSLWVNSAAMARAGITRETRSAPGGTIVRDASGVATGAFLEDADALFDDVTGTPSRAEKKIALKAALTHLVRLGVTGIDAIERDVDVWSLLQELEREGALPFTVHVGFPLEATLESAEQLRASSTANVRFGVLKLFVDGVIESKTAFMIDPYAGTESERGQTQIAPDEILRRVNAAHAAGFQVALHAIGDGAVRLALDAITAAHAAHPHIKTRHRIEHIEVLHPDDAARFQTANVIASMQPFHANPFGPDPWSGPWATNLGPARWGMTMPWKSLHDAFAPLTFGSDWPVFTANPLHALAVGRTRRDQNGAPTDGFSAHQALDHAALMHGYSVDRGGPLGPAVAVGVIAPNQRADVVLLSPDVRIDDPSTLWTGSVRTVIVNGRVWIDDGASAASTR